MSLFFTKKSEVVKMVEESFGPSEDYLVALKHNNPVKSGLKWLISNLYYVMDSSRTFILYFDHQGIHEKEISLSDHADFILIPWNEVEEFTIKDKGSKAILFVNHLGKTYSYSADFDGNLMRGNRERFLGLKEKNFYRENF